MDIRILGPLEVRDRGQPVELGAGKERALLAVLLLSPRKVVSIDRLIDALWPDDPPASALNSIHVYVSHLRKALGDHRLLTKGRGYQLVVDPEELDAARFERLLEESRALGAQGESREARATLEAALALWRGPPLSEFASSDFAQAEIARLEELRLTALEKRIDADLELGRHAELVPELEALVREHLPRERMRCQLMLALYRSGRQADALETYREGRRLLSAELGLEPGPGLKELERGILQQDPALEGPALAPPSGSALRRRGPLAIAVGAVALLVALAAVIFVETRGGRTAGLVSVSANALGVIDPERNKTIAQVPVGGRPVAVAAGLGAVWVANRDDRTVLRIDPKTRRVTRTIGLGTEVAGLAVGAGSVWVAGGNDSVVVRIRSDGVIQARIPFPPVAQLGANPVFAVTARAGSVWAAAFDGLYRIRAGTNEIDRVLRLQEPPVAAVAARSDVWLLLARIFGLIRFSPALGSAVATLRVGQFPGHVASGAGSVWVADGAGIVWRIEPASNRIAGSIRVGGGPYDVAVGHGAVWTANSDDGTVSRIDPRDEREVARVRVGHNPISVATGYGAVWVGVAARPPFLAGGR